MIRSFTSTLTDSEACEDCVTTEVWVNCAMDAVCLVWLQHTLGSLVAGGVTLGGFVWRRVTGNKHQQKIQNNWLNTYTNNGLKQWDR